MIAWNAEALNGLASIVDGCEVRALADQAAVDVFRGAGCDAALVDAAQAVVDAGTAYHDAMRGLVAVLVEAPS